MKKYFWFLIALFLAMADLYAGSNDDTVWTKNIWPEEVKNVMFSRDSTSPGDSKIFVSTDQRVWILNTLTGDSIRTVSGTGGFKYFSKDGKYIYTSTLKKLDAKTFQIVARYDTLGTKEFIINGMTLTGDGKYVIAISDFIHQETPPDPYHDNISIFSSTDLKHLKSLTFEESLIDITSSPDGKYFAVASAKYTIPVNNSGYQYTSLTLWDTKTFQIIKTIYQEKTGVNSIKFTPDSKYLTASIGGQVCFFETNNFNQIKQIKDFQESLTFSEDSKFMATGTLYTTSINVWNILTNNQIYKYNIGYGGAPVTISQNSKFVFSAHDWYLTLYNIKNYLLGIVKNDDLTKNMIIYPNPITGKATIEFDNTIAENVNIDIFNEKGIKIQNIFSGYLDSRKQIFYWDTNHIPNGVYLCNIVSKNLKLVTKIIISK